MNLSLYLIAGPELTRGRPLPDVVREAIAGGVTAVQLRAKDLEDREKYGLALALRGLCRQAGVLFIVNDRADLALAVGADGVHVGQGDLPVPVVRRLLGPQAVIGCSCETEAEARLAQQEGATYIGTGPVYATSTKADAGEPYGPAIVARMKAAVALPVVAIGGITPERAPAILAVGAGGLCVASAICAADDPAAAARAFRNLLDNKA